MRLSVLLISLAVAGGSIAARADVYRWVDGNGGVHYGDVPVQGAVLIRATGRSATPQSNSGSNENSSSSARDQVAAMNSAIRDKREQDDATRGVQDDLSKTRAKQCKDATALYEKSITSRRLYKEGKNGERIYLSDAELDQARVRARTERDAVCNAGKR